MKQRRLPSSWKPKNAQEKAHLSRPGPRGLSVLQTSTSHTNVKPAVARCSTNGRRPPAAFNQWRLAKYKGKNSPIVKKRVRSLKKNGTDVAVDLAGDEDALIVVGAQEVEESVGTACIDNSGGPGNDQHDGNQTPAEGFNYSCGSFWVYPVNRPLRDYQYEIVEKALFNNTMVVLPTGLGKTFIAAVVMYNYHRWYPSSKVIFLAPTKPLVAQQISACSEVMGLKKDDIVELTGAMSPTKRDQLWLKKNVFFLTPQTMANDLLRVAVDPRSIRLLVIDEAHKARGSYAYCTVVTEILKHHNQFRVMALTATPGSDSKVVQDVVNNLKISLIESRNEDQLSQYCHDRDVQKHVVALEGPILEIRTQFLSNVLMPLFGRLRHSGVLWRKQAEQMSRFDVLTAWNKYKEKQCASDTSDRLAAMMHEGFNVGVILFLAWEFLNNQGLRSMYCYLRGVIIEDKSPKAKKSLLSNADFMQIFNRLKGQFEGRLIEQLDASLMLATQAPKIEDGGLALQSSSEADVFYSHPKLKKLEEIVLDHFKNGAVNANNSRVIVFSTYRESVHEITELLLRHRPMIKAMSFVGQGNQNSSVTSSLVSSSVKEESSDVLWNENEGDTELNDRSLEGKMLPAKNSKGLKQAQQKRVIEKFKSGHFNVLVSTCVGEEGLDIGEVDLIINYDNPKSIVRLIQRAGRTGRKRHGIVHAIMTQGKEEQACCSSLNVESKLETVMKSLSSGKIKLCQFNPAVLPVDIKPVPLKLYLNKPPESDDDDDDDGGTALALKVREGKNNQGAKRVRGKKRKVSPTEFNPAKRVEEAASNSRETKTSKAEKVEERIEVPAIDSQARTDLNSTLEISGTKFSTSIKELKTSSVCEEDSEYLLAHQFFPLSPGGLKEWQLFNLGAEKASFIKIKTSQNESKSVVSEKAISVNLFGSVNDSPDEAMGSEIKLNDHGEDLEKISISKNNPIKNEEVIVLGDTDESILDNSAVVEEKQNNSEDRICYELNQTDSEILPENYQVMTFETRDSSNLPPKNILAQIRSFRELVSVPMFEENVEKTFDLKFNYCFRSKSNQSYNESPMFNSSASKSCNASVTRSCNDPLVPPNSNKRQVAVVMPMPMQNVPRTPEVELERNTCYYNSHNSWILESKAAATPLSDDACSSIVKRPQNKIPNRIELESSVKVPNVPNLERSPKEIRSQKRVSFVPPMCKNGKRKSVRSRHLNRFIDEEAAVGSSGGSDEESAVWNTQDINFLASQPVHDRSDMKYVYMRSIRSPKYPPENVKCIADLVRRKRSMPLNLQKKPMNRSDIFSQQRSLDQSTYMKGSFIVSSDEETEVCSEDEELDGGSTSSLNSSPEIGRACRKRRPSPARETPQHRKKHRRSKFKRLALESSSSDDE